MLGSKVKVQGHRGRKRRSDAWVDRLWGRIFFLSVCAAVWTVDHVAIPDFSAGAMENWGLVLYRESSILHDDVVSSISNKLWVSLVIAHEIAHTV